MKMRLIAIAAIALSPAVVLGQTRTHIRVTKDGTHSTTTQQTNGDVYTTPAPAAQPTPAPDTAMAPTTPPADTTVPKTDSSQLGTGAAAPTPTHSQQSDSSMTPMSDSSTMRTDSTTSTTTTNTPVDTVRVPRNPLQVSPTDSAKIGIPSTRQMQQRADSLRRANDTTTTTTPPPR